MEENYHNSFNLCISEEIHTPPEVCHLGCGHQSR